MLKNKYFNYMLFALVGLCIVFLLEKVAHIFNPIIDILIMFLSPIAISLFFFYALRPIIRFGEKYTDKKGLLVFTTLFLFILILTFTIGYGGKVIQEQFESSYIQSVSKVINFDKLFGDTFSNIIPDIDFTGKIFDSVKSTLLQASKNILSVFSIISNFGTQLVLIPFIIFYLLKDSDYFYKHLVASIPKRQKNNFLEMLSKIDEVLTIYISGQLFVAFVIGFLMFIGYLIIGLPNALLLGFLSMITAIIPFIGPFLGIIPALFIGLTINLSMLLKIIIVAVVVQQIEGNLVTPNIMGSKLQIHPLVVFFVVIIAVNLMGFMGAFVGIPLYMILVILFKTTLKIFTEEK